MAGSFIAVSTTGSEQISQALNKLLQQSNDLTPALADIGEHLLESTQQRFVQMQSPDGEAWQSLSELTLSRKNRTDRILTESGTLADTLNYQLNGNSLLFGSNEEYAAMHQFGGKTSPQSMIPNKEIPARPFLGFSADDQNEILAILQQHLSN